MKERLLDFLQAGFGKTEDLNCAEKILWGANRAYGLGIRKDDERLASGFGGGMGIGALCGAAAAAVMVLGRIFVKERAHEGGRIKELTGEFLKRFFERMESLDCEPTKEKYRSPVTGCDTVVFTAAEILDDIVSRECGDVSWIDV